MEHQKKLAFVFDGTFVYQKLRETYQEVALWEVVEHPHLPSWKDHQKHSLALVVHRQTTDEVCQLGQEDSGMPIDVL